MPDLHYGAVARHPAPLTDEERARRVAALRDATPRPILAVKEAQATAEYAARELLASAARTLRGASAGNKLLVFELQARHLFERARSGVVDKIAITDGLQEIATRAD
jgi:hypothetical protein